MCPPIKGGEGERWGRVAHRAPRHLAVNSTCYETSPESRVPPRAVATRAAKSSFPGLSAEVSGSLTGLWAVGRLSASTAGMRLPPGCEGRCGPMKAMCGRCCRLAIALALTVISFGASPRASADTGVTVFPGMQIRQGDTACMVGFVETRLRVALTTGQCDDGPLVTDRDRHLVGAVLLARRQAADDAANRAMLPVEYEVIALAPAVTVTDLLPTGHHLHETPAVRAQQGLPVCQVRVSAGQRCGSVGPVANGRFTMADMAVDSRDFGGPVYALTGDSTAVMVGLFEGMWGSAPSLESWQSVMWQLYVDCRARGSQQPPSQVRLAGLVRGA